MTDINPNVVNAIMRDIADFILVEAQNNILEMGISDRGFLLGSGEVTKTGNDIEVGFSAEHSCVIGGKHGVITEKTNENINSLKTKILSKDGKYHKAKNFSTGRFSQKPEGYLIKTEKQRGNGLLVTKDHLIITIRKNIPVWEEAQNLRVGDYVFRPRKIAYNKGNGDININCSFCKKIIKTKKWRFERYNKKYCLHKCYTDSNIGQKGPNTGKRRKMSLSERFMRSGKNNGAWKGGTSKLPYGNGWNKILKEKVKIRDNYTCQTCELKQEQSKYSFHVHHKDGNKFNNKISNLITLCPRCHGKEQWRDCELIDLDLSVFEPVKIISIKKIIPKENTKYNPKVKLWDLSVDGENSFVCNGILIHNSAVNDGTKPHSISQEGQNEIRSWVERKLSVPSNEVDKVTKSIIWSIRKKGTQPKPFWDKALADTLIRYRGNLDLT